MPIEDADKVHSKRGGRDSANITILGHTIGIMKLITIIGVIIGGLFLLVAAVLMMSPQPVIIPVQENPAIIINTTKISFDVMPTIYNC